MDVGTCLKVFAGQLATCLEEGHSQVFISLEEQYFVGQGHNCGIKSLTLAQKDI